MTKKEPSYEELSAKCKRQRELLDKLIEAGSFLINYNEQSFDESDFELSGLGEAHAGLSVALYSAKKALNGEEI